MANKPFRNPLRLLAIPFRISLRKLVEYKIENFSGYILQKQAKKSPSIEGQFFSQVGLSVKFGLLF